MRAIVLSLQEINLTLRFNCLTFISKSAIINAQKREIQSLFLSQITERSFSLDVSLSCSPHVQWMKTGEGAALPCVDAFAPVERAFYLSLWCKEEHIFLLKRWTRFKSQQARQAIPPNAQAPPTSDARKYMQSYLITNTILKVPK